MTTLNLGVVDIPYAYEQEVLSKKGKPLKRKKTVTKSITTGEVAEILEEKYHVMEIFFEIHGEQIMELLTDAVVGAYETAAMGGPTQAEPHAEALEKIGQMFRDFLSNQEMDGYHGEFSTLQIPTRAAREGVSHRFAHPYAHRPERPSFIDTGEFQAAFTAWIEK